MSRNSAATHCVTSRSAASRHNAKNPQKVIVMQFGHVKEASLLSLAVSGGLLMGISVAVGLLYFVKMPSTQRKPPQEIASQNPSDSPTAGGSSSSGSSGSVAATTASSPSESTSSQGGDTENLSEDQKKKINVFGYDTQQRTAMAEFLIARNVAKFKANASALIVAGKLISAAKSLGLKPDESNRIEFPADTNFERMFEDGTLINKIDIAKVPEVFVPLVEKYSKGTANPTERKLAFFVLAAFYLSEIK